MKKPRIHIDTDPKLIRQLICENRWVIVKNDNLVPAGELVEFYKSLGTCHTQDESFMSQKYIDEYSEGYRELIPVRNKNISGYGENGLFAGEEDGEVYWHSASNNHDFDEDVVAFCIRRLGIGGELSLCDGQQAYIDLNTDMLDDIEVEYSLGRQTAREDEQQWIDAWNFKHYKDSDGTPRHLRENQFQPLVTVNPLNDKKGFTYSFLQCKGYKDHDHDEFLKIHNMVVESMMDNVEVHTFELGDIVLQEQYQTLHHRAAYSGDRLLWRSAIWF